ncbi:MAG: hypothetical protein LBH30_07445 [Prevotellaceae bacterium]|nr:hypothetical protein [Prevotellaceae bacterium]
MQLSEILHDSDYRQSQFDLVQIHEFERKIIVKTDKNGKEIPYIQCAIRKKEIRLTPEEAIRQLFLEVLMNDYQYPTDCYRVGIRCNFRAGKHTGKYNVNYYRKNSTFA